MTVRRPVNYEITTYKILNIEISDFIKKYRRPIILNKYIITGSMNKRFEHRLQLTDYDDVGSKAAVKLNITFRGIGRAILFS